jgi:hypothetical protein
VGESAVSPGARAPMPLLSLVCISVISLVHGRRRCARSAGVLAGVGWPGVGGQMVHADQTGDQQPLPHGFHFPRAPAHAVRTPYGPDVRCPLVSFAGERLPVSR